METFVQKLHDLRVPVVPATLLWLGLSGVLQQTAGLRAPVAVDCLTLVTLARVFAVSVGS